MSSIDCDSTGLDLSDFKSDDFDDDDFLQSATPFMKQSNDSSNPSNQPKFNTYLRKVESDALEECNVLINNVNQISKEVKTINSYEYYTVYFHCPICLNSGFKTIQHIKLCANKNLINPKDVICLLKQCPKTKRQKFSCNKISKAKLSNKEKAKRDKQYELLIFNEQYKQDLVQRRVSKLLISKNLCQKFTENSLDSLPLSWKMSHLTFSSKDYIIDEFSAYF